jgi:hypothetical protein
MLHEGDQQGVEYRRFVLGRQSAHQLQECHITQVDLAQQVVDQIEAPHHDAVGGAPAHLRAQRGRRRVRVSLACCIIAHLAISPQ